MTLAPMRTRNLLILPAVVAALAGAAGPASAADLQHVVARGESLTSVAAADGLSVSELAAANGLSPAAELIAGAQLAIPPRGEAPAAAAVPAARTGADASSSVAAPAPSATASGYLVQPGDTLSAIAGQSGVSVASLAAANGLPIDGVLQAGATLSVSGGSSAPPPAGAAAAPTGGAQPSSGTVSASDIGTIAAENGVSPSLAEAIGYQESGFNNAKVSATGATGVMQIEPGTWSYIHSVLGGTSASASAADNIRGGVELLHSLLAQTGGDAAAAAAGYYQGLQSVRRHGLYADTQRYVRDVMALQGRFGGG